MAAAQSLALALCAGGIYASYLTQGFVSERISTARYGPSGERFPSLVALNLMQSAACVMAAAAVAMLFKAPETKQTKAAGFRQFVLPGLTSSIGPACGLLALKNISYPAQVLAKSCKMVPVMIMGTVVSRGKKRYSFVEYLAAILIGVGIGVFSLAKSSAKAKAKLASPNPALGYGRCIVNLAFDGYTNAKEDDIIHAHPDTTSLGMMMHMNLWSVIFNGAYLTYNGELARAADFARAYPECATDAVLFCLSGAMGQLFIYYTINTFGSLAVTTITTTRKFINVLISVFVLGNPLLAMQWVGVGMVFTGLSASIASKATKKKKTT